MKLELAPDPELYPEDLDLQEPVPEQVKWLQKKFKPRMKKWELKQKRAVAEGSPNPEVLFSAPGNVSPLSFTREPVQSSSEVKRPISGLNQPAPRPGYCANDRCNIEKEGHCICHIVGAALKVRKHKKTRQEKKDKIRKHKTRKTRKHKTRKIRKHKTRKTKDKIR